MKEVCNTLPLGIFEILDADGLATWLEAAKETDDRAETCAV